MKVPFTHKQILVTIRFAGLSTGPASAAFTSTINFAVTVASALLQVLMSMATIQRAKPCFNITAATSTSAPVIIARNNKTNCSSPTAKITKQQERKLSKERWLEAKPAEIVATLWLSCGNTKLMRIMTKTIPTTPKKNETYPHAIVYAFEANQDKAKTFQPTKDLKYESEHVPVSVSIADTLIADTFICSKNPSELIQKSYEALDRRSAAIRADVCA